jgi:transposase
LGYYELAKKRVRRFWSDDEKRVICAQTRVAGVSVAQVARRYSLNANLVFRWLREPKFQRQVPDIDGATFLPVEISTESEAILPTVPQLAPVRDSCSRSIPRIEIATADGHRVTVEGDFDGDALARLLKGLVS